MRQFLFVTAFALATVLHPGQSFAQQASAPAAETRAETVAGIRHWFNEAHATAEVFRLKQLKHFVSVRDEMKKKLKIEQPEKNRSTVIDIGIAGGLDDTDERVVDTTLDSPLDYARYIMALSMVALFSNVMVFYVSALLLGLILLRFLVSLLV